jgi:hypothetical protein
VPVALPGPAGSVDFETLGTLAQSGSWGGLFRATDPHQLRQEDALQARFRIRADKADTFAPGRSVLRQVMLEVCPFDCFQTHVPFSVQIP